VIIFYIASSAVSGNMPLDVYDVQAVAPRQNETNSTNAVLKCNTYPNMLNRGDITSH